MQIEQVGEQAVVLSVSYEQTRDCVAAVNRINRYIENHWHPAVQSIRPGLDCILIEFAEDPSFGEWVLSLQDVEERHADGMQQALPSDAVTRSVPICYEYGYDLPEISNAVGLSVDEIIDMHSSREYSIWMIGFMPGFPYMGELPQRLQIRRKTNPDLSIPAGSVAIAEEYVGIYPFDSPGGWHVIGRTPLKIVDYSKEIPCTLDYGMKVRFEPITPAEFERRLR